MAVVKENPVWVTGITQIDPNDPVQGGAGGVDNVPHEQLANRTAYLKKEIEDIQGEPTEPVTLETLLKRIKDLEEAPTDNLPFLPVGGLFETTVVYTSGAEVAAAMGYGTWVSFGEGLVTVGVSSKTADPGWTKVIGTEYGEYEHSLIIDEAPAHKHSKDDVYNKFGSNASESGLETQGSGDYDHLTEEYGTGNLTSSNWLQATEQSVGGGEPHNNTQPSVVVGRWRRTE
ncbi:phage baseplate protein [Psychrobacter aquaticus]|uniref:Putative prophage LambdaSa04, minor structural protein n=1 Tax=Psychrobacter aquaticus CMS 56 TaxID=1354303 RepID=U4TBN9_9GAMM|nr:putative prophage LambdaSa04, minor structural protein [Psychrobacter aquaticus]ERL56124.1 putative prophage LambdaSa04, minor structural protein [Psychrobacter aquaticus CMS 56]